MKQNPFIKSVTIFATTALLLTACTPMTATRGNFVLDEQLQEVKIGQDTRANVLQKMGSPTTKAPFNDNLWYYLGQKTEKRGVLDPDVVEERIIAVHFDEKGTLTKVEEIDNERLNVPVSDRKTPTSGHNMTVMQQLLGNLGKYNNKEE